MFKQRLLSDSIPSNFFLPRIEQNAFATTRAMPTSWKLRRLNKFAGFNERQRGKNRMHSLLVTDE